MTDLSWFKLAALFQGLMWSSSVFFSVFWKDSLHFSPMQIGIISGLGIIISIIAPFFFGHLGTHRSNQKLVAFCFITAALLAPLFLFEESFVFQLGSYSLLQFMQAGFVTLVPVGVLHLLGKNAGQEYGKYRRIGSIGYVLGALLAGRLVDYFHPGAFLGVIFSGALLAAWPFLTRLKVPVIKDPSGGKTRYSDVLNLAGMKSFYLTTILISWWRGPFFIFLSLRMKEMGSSESVIADMYSLCGITALLTFALAGKIADSFSTRLLYQATALAASLRLLFLGLPESNYYWFLAIQILHIPTFVLGEVVQMKWIRDNLPGQMFPRGQGLLQTCIALGFGLSATGFGLLTEWFSLRTSFLISAIFPLIGWILFHFFGRRAQVKTNSQV